MRIYGFSKYSSKYSKSAGLFTQLTEVNDHIPDRLKKKMWSHIFILIKYSEMHHIVKVKWVAIAVSCSVCGYIRGR